MDRSLLDIQAELAKKALELEKARFSAHEQAMVDLAKAKAEEELKQKEAQLVRNLAQEKHHKRKKEVQEAIEQSQKEEAEVKRLIEQEENRKQEEIDRTIAFKEQLKKKMDDMEFAEEQAKKELRNIMFRMDSSEEAPVEHPLGKFLQPQPE